jgi:hypothetical protein
MKPFVILIPLLCGLPACVQFKAKPLSAEQSSVDFSGRSLGDAGLRAFMAEHKAASGSWNVDRLALAAAYFHPDVALARAEAEEVAAGDQNGANEAESGFHLHAAVCEFSCSCVHAVVPGTEFVRAD